MGFKALLPRTTMTSTLAAFDLGRDQESYLSDRMTSLMLSPGPLMKPIHRILTPLFFLLASLCGVNPANAGLAQDLKDGQHVLLMRQASCSVARKSSTRRRKCCSSCSECCSCLIHSISDPLLLRASLAISMNTDRPADILERDVSSVLDKPAGNYAGM